MAKENPNAFPSVETDYGKVGEKYDIHHDGMTLRDYFAGQVMSGMVSNSDVLDRIKTNEAAASYAYELADSMLEERSKNV